MKTNDGSGGDDLLDKVERKRASVGDKARPEAVAKQHAAGKLTARERIEALLDDGSFLEVGALVEPRRDTVPTQDIEAPADGVVTGTGRLNERPLGVVATDYTVLGGSFGTTGGLKVERAAQLAMKHGYPLIQLHDGGGHRIQEALESRHSASGTGNWMHFSTQVQMSGWVPMVSAVLGPGFAGPSNFSALADFVVMVRGQSTMGAAGPALVKMATGEDLTNEELGGAHLQVDRYGVADLGVDDEDEAFAAIRRFLSYLPDNASQPAPILDSDDPVDRRDAELRDIVPANLRRAYDVRDIISRIVDRESVFELKPTYARNIVTAFARLAGRPVGVIANQPKQLAGCVTAEACEKAARFVSMCDAFGLPIVSLIDTPGLLVGEMAERSGLVLRSGRMLFELGSATVPLLVVVLRKGYGLGYVLMGGGREFDADLCVTWPTAYLCGMQVEGAVDIAYQRDIATADNPEETREELVEMYKDQVGVLQTAESFAVDDVIDPKDTRLILIDTLERAGNRRATTGFPPKVHGISPI